jgi:hypothetical protein
MGTNYYIQTKKCRTCKHVPTPIHIGKSSGGWKFSFNYNNGIYYKNIAEMREWVKDKLIEDEYGKLVTHAKFWRLVAMKQSEKLAHAEQHPSENDFMIDGYSFTNGEFS